jgi:DNA mismatch repair protein MutL
LEVRFSKEFELTRLVTDTVRNKWARQDLVPQIIRAETAGPTAPMAPVSPAPPPYRELPLFTPRTIDRLLEAPPVQEQPPTPQLPKLFPIGQVHGTYIVAQNERGMYLIDQHAAHERIHYEQFLGKMAQTEVVSQDLLVPMTLTFTATEAHLVTQKLPFLEAVGVWLEPFGGNSFIVRSHPAWFPVGDEQRIIEDMVDWLLQEKQTPDIGKIREKTAIMAACKASIRANDSLTVTAMETLLERLRACRMPFTCPHGRPIVISFSVHELEKLFKRVT